MVEQLANQQDAADGQRDVEHALGEEWELAVTNLLEVEARREGCHEQQQQQP